MQSPVIGIDIIEIDRIREAADRWGGRFLDRVFTPVEIELYRGKPASLAARFAGKEAVMKALSTPLVTLAWKDIEILSGTEGKPIVVLSPRAEARAREMGLSGMEITISHSRQNAVALVFGVPSD